MRERRVLPLVVWCVGLVAGTVFFHGLGHAELAAPPLHPAGWGPWVEGRPPAVAVIAVLRLVVVGLCWYLVGVTTIGLVGRLLRAARLVRLADALTLPWLRRLLQQGLGVALATAMVTSAAGVVPAGAHRSSAGQEPTVRDTVTLSASAEAPSVPPGEVSTTAGERSGVAGGLDELPLPPLLRDRDTAPAGGDTQDARRRGPAAWDTADDGDGLPLTPQEPDAGAPTVGGPGIPVPGVGAPILQGPRAEVSPAEVSRSDGPQAEVPRAEVALDEVPRPDPPPVRVARDRSAGEDGAEGHESGGPLTGAEPGEGGAGDDESGGEVAGADVGEDGSLAGYVVRSGDSLWRIAEQQLAGALERAPEDAEIVPYWRELIEHNRARLPDPEDPDLILPGQRLELPRLPEV